MHSLKKDKALSAVEHLSLQTELTQLIKDEKQYVLKGKEITKEVKTFEKAMKAAEKQIYRKTKQMHPVYNELHKMEKGKEELLEKLKECEDEEAAEKVLDEIQLLERSGPIVEEIEHLRMKIIKLQKERAYT